MSYDFTVILDDSPQEPWNSWITDLAERLFPQFQGDAIPSVIAGQAEIGCSLEAASMEEAIRQARDSILELGLAIRRIEIAPDSIPSGF